MEAGKAPVPSAVTIGCIGMALGDGKIPPGTIQQLVYEQRRPEAGPAADRGWTAGHFTLNG